MNYFQIIIGESNGGEGTSRKHGDPYKRIRQIGPQQCGHDDRDCNQQAAHRGRARFLLVSFRPFFADVLAYLELAQPANHERTHDEPGEQRCQTGKSGAKSQVAENSERREVMEQL